MPEIDKRTRYLVRYMPFTPEVIRYAGGTWIETVTGRRILDFASGQICSTLGHRHPHITEALEEALRSVAHLDSSMLSEPVLALAELLAGSLPEPLQKVLLLSTGTEANDIAIKMAKLATSRFEVVGVAQGFHGLSGGMSSYTFLSARRGYGPLLPGAMAIPAPYAYRCPVRHCTDTCDMTCLDVGFQHIDKTTSGSLAAFVMEPVLSSGGVIVPPDGYLSRARELAHERGMHFILDESQTGLGRLGRMYGFEDEQAVPDTIALSKTLGGGIPLAATVTRDDIEDICVRRGFSHNTSHVSDPLPAAAGVAVVRTVLGDQLADAALRSGDYLRACLGELSERHEIIGDVRGKGLLCGVEFVDDRDTRAPALGLAKRVGRECFRRGLSMHAIPTGPNAHCFRIAPPLTVGRDEIDLAADILDAAITDVLAKRGD